MQSNALKAYIFKKLKERASTYILSSLGITFIFFFVSFPATIPAVFSVFSFIRMLHEEECREFVKHFVNFSVAYKKIKYKITENIKK